MAPNLRPTLSTRIRASFDSKQSKSNFQNPQSTNTFVVQDATMLRDAIGQAINNDSFQNAIAAHLAKLIEPSIREALDTIQPVVETVYQHDVLLRKTNRSVENLLQHFDSAAERKDDEKVEDNKSRRLKGVDETGDIKQLLVEHSTHTNAKHLELSKAIHESHGTLSQVVTDIAEIKSTLSLSSQSLVSLKGTAQQTTTDTFKLQEQLDELKTEMSKIMKSMDIQSNTLVRIKEADLATAEILGSVQESHASHTAALNEIKAQDQSFKSASVPIFEKTHAHTATAFQTLTTSLGALKDSIKSGFALENEIISALDAKVDAIISSVDLLSSKNEQREVLAAVQKSNELHIAHGTALESIKNGLAESNSNNGTPNDTGNFSVLQDHLKNIAITLDSHTNNLATIKENDKSDAILKAIHNGIDLHALHRRDLADIKAAATAINESSSTYGPDLSEIKTLSKAADSSHMSHTADLGDIKSAVHALTESHATHVATLEAIKTANENTFQRTNSQSRGLETLETQMGTVIATLGSQNIVHSDIRDAVHSSNEAHASHSADLLDIKNSVKAANDAHVSHTTALESLKTASDNNTEAAASQIKSLTSMESQLSSINTNLDSQHKAHIEARDAVQEFQSSHLSALDGILAAHTTTASKIAAQTTALDTMGTQLGDITTTLDQHGNIHSEVKDNLKAIDEANVSHVAAFAKTETALRDILDGLGISRDLVSANGDLLLSNKTLLESARDTHTKSHEDVLNHILALKESVDTHGFEVKNFQAETLQSHSQIKDSIKTLGEGFHSNERGLGQSKDRAAWTGYQNIGKALSKNSESALNDAESTTNDSLIDRKSALGLAMAAVTGGGIMALAGKEDLFTKDAKTSKAPVHEASVEEPLTNEVSTEGEKVAEQKSIEQIDNTNNSQLGAAKPVIDREIVEEPVAEEIGVNELAVYAPAADEHERDVKSEQKILSKISAEPPVDKEPLAVTKDELCMEEPTVQEPLGKEIFLEDSSAEPKELEQSAPVRENAVVTEPEHIHVAEPIVEDSVVLNSAAEESTVEEPTVEEPVETTIKESAIEKPAIEEPVIEQSIIEGPKETAIEELAVEESKETAVECAAVEEPAVEEPVVTESAIEYIAAKDLAIEEPTLEEPATKHHLDEKPIYEDFTDEEPVYEASTTEVATEEPVYEASTAEAAIDELVYEASTTEVATEELVYEASAAEAAIDEPVFEASTAEIAADKPPHGHLAAEMPAAELAAARVVSKGPATEELADEDLATEEHSTEHLHKEMLMHDREATVKKSPAEFETTHQVDLAAETDSAAEIGPVMGKAAAIGPAVDESTTTNRDILTQLTAEEPVEDSPATEANEFVEDLPVEASTTGKLAIGEPAPIVPTVLPEAVQEPSTETLAGKEAVVEGLRMDEPNTKYERGVEESDRKVWSEDCKAIAVEPVARESVTHSLDKSISDENGMVERPLLCDSTIEESSNQVLLVTESNHEEVGIDDKNADESIVGHQTREQSAEEISATADGPVAENKLIKEPSIAGYLSETKLASEDPSSHNKGQSVGNLESTDIDTAAKYNPATHEESTMGEQASNEEMDATEGPASVPESESNETAAEHPSVEEHTVEGSRKEALNGTDAVNESAIVAKVATEESIAAEPAMDESAVPVDTALNSETIMEEKDIKGNEPSLVTNPNSEEPSAAIPYFSERAKNPTELIEENEPLVEVAHAQNNEYMPPMKNSSEVTTDASEEAETTEASRAQPIHDPFLHATTDHQPDTQESLSQEEILTKPVSDELIAEEAITRNKTVHANDDISTKAELNRVDSGVGIESPTEAKSSMGIQSLRTVLENPGTEDGPTERPTAEPAPTVKSMEDSVMGEAISEARSNAEEVTLHGPAEEGKAVLGDAPGESQNSLSESVVKDTIGKELNMPEPKETDQLFDASAERAAENQFKDVDESTPPNSLSKLTQMVGNIFHGAPASESAQEENSIVEEPLAAPRAEKEPHIEIQPATKEQHRRVDSGIEIQPPATELPSKLKPVVEMQQLSEVDEKGEGETA